MTDQERLSALIAVWWEAIDSFTHLLEHVGDDQWDTATDLPGWDVRAVAAHTAHLESLLAGRPHDDIEIGDLPHVRGMMGRFTEQGVVARGPESPDALITEIRESTTVRHTQLLADPPTDPSAPAPGVFGAIGWTTGLLLRNRPLDVWMHEQDIRRALDLPGNLDSAPAIHAADYLMESLPYVVGKRAQVPVGGVVRLEVAGHEPVTVTVGEDGRGRVATSADGDPTTTLSMDRETFVVLSGGRRRADPDAVGISGDTALGEQVHAAMAVTPVSEAAWTTDDIGDLTGRTAVVTGPTLGGLGFHTSLELARHGARVVLAGRTPAKLEAASQAITAEVPGAALETLVVDLSDLAAVRAAAEAARSLGPLHLLVNNAGIMATPMRRTGDGLESQLATNHFGPFLLTGLLLDQLVASGEGRVVTLSSQMHRLARSAPVGDPHAQRRHSRWLVYAQTKLANLLFTFELDRRLRRAGLPVLALAAHPGFAGTHLAVNGQLGSAEGRRAAILDAAVKAVSQTAAAGAWPSLMAATADLPGGTYVGPGGPGQSSGRPRVVGAAALAHDESAQRRLWEISERTVGLSWP